MNIQNAKAALPKPPQYSTKHEKTVMKTVEWLNCTVTSFLMLNTGI